MADERWTAETEALVAGVHHAGRCDCGAPDEPSLHEAREILTALVDAGLLLPPGGETREEWAVQFTEHHVSLRPLRTRAEAETEILERTTHGYTHPGSPVSRTVHTGLWRPVDTEEAKP